MPANRASNNKKKKNYKEINARKHKKSTYRENARADVEGFNILLERIRNWFSERTALDFMLMGGGALILVIAVILAAAFFKSEISGTRANNKLASIGKDVQEIDVIGHDGIQAVIEAKRNALGVSEENQDEAFGVDESQLQESEAKIEEIVKERDSTPVVMNLSSIKRDLKIKFVDNDTKQLIKGVSFEITITDPDGNKSNKTNSDQDGIIYLSSINPGKYQVALVGPDDEKYSFLKDPVAITVKDTIEYKKVDITGEIKKESEVNVAKEDTAKNDTAVESTNTDTVEWVESTKTLLEGSVSEEASYEEVSKDKISDPGIASIAVRHSSRKYEPDTPSEDQQEEANEEKPGEAEKSEAPSPTPSEASDDKKDEAKTPEATPSEEPSKEPTPSKTPEATPTPSATSSKTPSPSPSATSTPTESPSATPSATPSPSTKSEKEEAARKDTTTALKTTSGEVLYVREKAGDVVTYRPAKVADYYVFDKFYRQVGSTEGKYKYTGWQKLDGHTYYFDKDGKYVTGEQVIQGAKYSFDSEGRLSTGSGVLGIDVSKWNGSINWQAVKDSGVSFVIIRCGFRGSSEGALVEDANFRTNIQGATNAGLKVGVYFFTQAVNEVEAVEEASMVLNQIQGYNISYPVYLDVEPSGGRGDSIDAGTRTAVCQAFCKTIANSGYKSGIYANKTWLGSKINTASLTNYKIWLAQYAAAPSYTATRYDMWQYSSKGSVSGISGNVDMNISYLGY